MLANHAGAATAALLGLSLVLAAFAPTAAAQPQCYHIYFEKDVGPYTVTLTSSCSGSTGLVEDGGLATTQDDSSPSDDPVECTLHAEDGRDLWWCYFGAPGP